MTDRLIPHYDVIITGSGSIGTPAALYLAQAGYKTLVVDGCASVGQGSNKRAIGGVRATHSDPAKILLCLRSIEIFRTWEEVYGDDIEWITGGYNFVAYREQEEATLKTLLAKQKALGLNIEWYDKDDLLKIIPDLNPVDLIGGNSMGALLGAQYACGLPLDEIRDQTVRLARGGERPTVPVISLVSPKHR